MIFEEVMHYLDAMVSIYISIETNGVDAEEFGAGGKGAWEFFSEFSYKLVSADDVCRE